MKKTYVLLTLTLIVLSIKNINSQTIWNGPIITFSKENNADWTLEVNQDRITDNVWITRKSNQSLFNIAKETGSGSSSPLDTEWAYGTTSNLSNLTFDTFNKTHGSNPRSAINRDMVVHLITDDIYIDIKFTSFSGGGSGGGFTYERSTNHTLNTNRFTQDKAISLTPNPSKNFIKINGLTETKKYTIYNLLGTVINTGKISKSKKIDIQKFKSGLYFLKFEKGDTFKFVKI